MFSLNQTHLGKSLMFILLLFTSIQVSAKNNFTLKKEKDGHTTILINRGDKLAYDSLTVFNSDTHKIEKRPNRFDTSPVMINGKNVICGSDEKSQEFKMIAESSHQFNKYLVDNTKNLWEQLGDGVYGFPILNIEVDENGELAYCEIGDSLCYTPIVDHIKGLAYAEPCRRFEISESLNKTIYTKMYQLLKEMPKLKPLQINSITQPYCLMSLPIVVKDHHVISY